MKTAASVASCWALMLGLLALLLVSAPAAAQGTIPDIGGVTAPAPAPVAPAPAPAPGTNTSTINPPAIDEDEEEDPVVVDILVAGVSTEQSNAINALLNVLGARTDMTSDRKKVNSTVEWEPKHHGHADHHERLRLLRGRALRNVVMAKALKDGHDDTETDPASNATRCEMIVNGGNYSVVHITLHGKADKVLVENVMKLLEKFNPGMFSYICKTNVRMQSQAPPADFAPMAEEEPEGLSGGQKAGIAIGVVGGAAVVGAVGFFAFKGFGAAAATV